MKYTSNQTSHSFLTVEKKHLVTYVLTQKKCKLKGIITIKLVYLNGNNAAEGENNIKYANSYPMN